MNDEMKRRQDETNKLQVLLVDEFEVVNITLPPSGQRVVDVVLTTLSQSQERTTIRLRFGPSAAQAFVRDLQGAQLRATGSPPPTH